MKRKGKRRAAAIAALLALCAAAVCALMLMLRLRPLAEELAAAVVDNRASDVINDAVGDVLAREEIGYDQIVLFEKDLDGGITALKTNVLAVNRLKVLILDEIGARSDALCEDELSIALGSLLVPSFFTGRGPEIPVRIVGIVASDATFSGRFSDAGINQTLHQIVLNVELTVTVVLPTGTLDVQTRTQMIVAETVLIGAVPSSYLHMGSNTEEIKTGE